MKKILGLVLISGFFFLTAITSPKNASASEGVVEMRNLIGQQSRCYATSVLTSDLQYNILVSCRDLLYPVSQELFRYIVWITPTTGTNANPIKLGELGIGKALYKTQTPFSGIFVTQEKTTEVTTPSGQTAMRGNVSSVPFLDNPSSPQQIQPESQLLSPSPQASPAASARNIGTLLRSGAVVTVIAIFVVILMLVLVKPFK